MIIININFKLIFCSPRTAIAQLDNQNTKKSLFNINIMQFTLSSYNTIL